MISTKIILSLNQRILEIAIAKYSLEKINNENDIVLYEKIVLN